LYFLYNTSLLWRDHVSKPIPYPYSHLECGNNELYQNIAATIATNLKNHGISFQHRTLSYFSKKAIITVLNEENRVI